MSKVVQKGAAAALRIRSMSSIAEKKLTPEQIAEYGKKINPCQTKYGPKSAEVEKWQKFFQDPLNVEKPIFLRKGATDEIVIGLITAAIAGQFIYICYDFCAN